MPLVSGLRGLRLVAVEDSLGLGEASSSLLLSRVEVFVRAPSAARAGLGVGRVVLEADVAPVALGRSLGAEGLGGGRGLVLALALPFALDDAGARESEDFPLLLILASPESLLVLELGDAEDVDVDLGDGSIEVDGLAAIDLLVDHRGKVREVPEGEPQRVLVAEFADEDDVGEHRHD